MRTLCVDSVPVNTPKVPQALGVSWNPQAQLGSYSLKGPYILVFSTIDWELLLPANPSRMAWYAQVVDSTATLRLWAGDTVPQSVALAVSDHLLPFRITAVDYPGLCQGSWKYFLLPGQQIFVWELESNY